jgi:hypothetical protein
MSGGIGFYIVETPYGLWRAHASSYEQAITKARWGIGYAYGNPGPRSAYKARLDPSQW